MKNIETEVIVVGGGITGAGIIRDLSQRGIPAVLVEKDDIAYGATGRNHGLLHSGARYAVKDLESARECISENRILKSIARHCIEDTGGLFVTLPDDDPMYHHDLLEGCRIAGIKTDDISTKEALRLEPNLNEKILSAIYVPDGIIDPFRLTSANILDAEERGGRTFTHTKVTEVITLGGRAAGVRCQAAGGDLFEIHGSIIINAAGVWGQHICETAGVELKMFPSKGSMLIIDYRVNNIVINRCRPPSDGDIIVPGDTVSIIGTTSRQIDYDCIEYLTVDDDEIEVLLGDGEKLIPNVSRARALRAYAGVRPLVAISGETSGRDISRGIVLIDHAERDGLDGFITIAGGKLMTYRLMAEMTVDMAAKKLGVKKGCTTHRTPLPGSERKMSPGKNIRAFTGIPNSVVGSTLYRHGHRVHGFLKRDRKNYRLICECEMVTEGEVEYALKKLNVRDLVDLRRRTRVGMGPCQGELCAYRSAGLFQEYGSATPVESATLLRDFLEERWKGVKPVLWGDTLRESEFTYWIYEGLFGLGNLKD
ncbi:MAG: anaerobic glycerol-3-phosphate dehydrogenase subunit A [Spirochaetes bacterium]|nr:anaerobic glycerol-3-phosphate dehydrogenase subunit A [Spirochaetota bacterium]